MQYLGQKGFLLTDFGSDDPIYANVAIKVAEAVSRKEYDRGILICGTGLGVSIAANKVKGAYAALITDVYSAERARKSNNANIACFGAFTIGIQADGKTGRDLSLLRVYSRVRISAKDRSNCRL